MPTAALHSHYWAGDQAGGSAPGTGASARGGYPVWQTSVVCAGGFGALQVVWEMFVEKKKEDDGKHR